MDRSGAWYAAGDRQIHLIVHPPTRTLRGTTAIDIADGHLALRVRDYDAAVAHLRANGVMQSSKLVDSSRNASRLGVKPKRVPLPTTSGRR